MGKKNKNQEDYWASEEFEKDQQLLDEKSPAPAKPEPKKEQKATPVASENESAKQPQATVLGGTTLGSTQQKKKNNNKKKKANQNQQDEGADAEESQNAEKSQPKKTDAVEKEGKDSTTPAPAEDTKGEKEDEDDGTSGGASAKDKKKKKKGKGTAAATETAPAPSKKSTIGKKLAEALAKQREEEERKQKEEEERLKREQEEEEKRLEEERRQEEIRLAKKEKKKLKEKERLVAKQQKEKEQKIAQMKQQFVNQGVNISIPALESETASTEEQKPQKREKPVYAKKKKFNKNNDDDDKPTQPVQPVQAVEVKEAKEEVADDWESKADSWEDLNADELTPVAEKKEPPKQEVAKPAPKPESALVPAPKPTGGKKKGRGKEVEEPKEKPFRSPICVVLGHVDTGKTKLLDKIRRTNVQEGEAGGITQQIGATYFPMDNLKDQIGGPVLSKVFSINGSSIDIKVPGLLIIDTPGHESFTNLRSRGTSLCDIAILVVDIMHGLEQQTIESINLLKSRKTPFVVALNKIDRIYGWKANPGAAIQDTLAKQDKMVIMEFEKRVKDTITYFAEQSLNAALYYKNPDIRKYVSFVPTSAVTGEGIPDLLLLLVQLTQQMMSHRLTLSDELQCTVLEVKVVEGLGTTIDVILVNGELNEGDTIVICGLNGPIVTTIRALLTPQPMKEIRVKGSYIHHKNIKAAQGVKISAADLDKAIAGSSLCVCGPDDDLEELKKEVMSDFDNMIKKVSTVDKGVYVQASTLGSLEALLDFLTQSKIPVSSINIGPVNKKDVTKASVMKEHAPEYAVILAFDVKVSKEAREAAEDLGVTIFEAEIIYHLFDKFTKYMEDLTKKKQEESAPEAVWPCRLKIFPEYIFNKRDPIVLGVEVVEGTLRVGTPICVPTKEFIYLGRVTSVEINHKAVTEAKKGSSVAMKIEQPDVSAQQYMYARHFDASDELVSRISRQSIDVLKTNFKSQVTKEDVVLLAKLKTVFSIQ